MAVEVIVDLNYWNYFTTCSIFYPS